MDTTSQPGGRARCAGACAAAAERAVASAARERRTEAAVRRALARGRLDEAATRIIRAYRPFVVRTLRRWLRDDDDVADAFAAVAEHVWLGVARFRADAALRTWVYRVAANAAADVRKQARRRRGVRLERRGSADACAAPSQVPDRERRDCLDRMRAWLSEDERRLLTLRVDQELPWEAVARALSPAGRRLDATTVLKRFERLAARLRRLAAQHGFLR